MTASSRAEPARAIADGFDPADFSARHIGPGPADVAAMLQTLELGTLDELIARAVPASIRLPKPLALPEAATEAEALAELRALAAQNTVAKSFIGMGYYGTIVPPVILRNVLENPGWYTQYTPYQAEISQGRLEALLNFQTMVSDLTGLPLANASLLDEATAAAEAMGMCYAIAGDDGDKNAFFVSTACHPQTIAVVQARAAAIGVETIVAEEAELLDPQCAYLGRVCGVLVQYPATDGRINDYGPLTDKMHASEALVVVACDLLALTLIKPPGEFGARGADIAVGSAQRFGVPMGYGGPHAAFMATKQEFVRKMPGRLVGVSRDAQGNPAYRLTLQTREQHIRREKATSNICTAQVLLAIMASMYAVYHGPEGLKAIARRVHARARALAAMLQSAGHKVHDAARFDTVRVQVKDRAGVLERAAARGVNLRELAEGALTVSVDETTSDADVALLGEIFGAPARANMSSGTPAPLGMPHGLARSSSFLTHPVFNGYHSETEMLRYLTRLQSKDLSLAVSMIPLGSCTMKLNATAEMIPITWPEFANLHPFAPRAQAVGYHQMFAELEKWLAEITGFAAVSLQPNAGSQGEYAGLLTIRAYHASRGDTQRKVCLIPTSAHGTNPASAVTAGFAVVPVACDDQGNVDLQDLKAKAAEHARALAAIMLTYPSTHGVFEEGVKEICRVVHEHGGQVYMDGANMNAQVGLTSPAVIGADVCHLNLHKTFCIPHGGGGPGMGPIAVAEHLAPFLPGHPVVSPFDGEAQGLKSPGLGKHAIGPISAAPWGSAAILPISWMYIRMMGEAGLKRASEVAILNANYIARRLDGHYTVLYKGAHGLCAHECIIDCRPLEDAAGIKVEDIAKRLMDYGFHAPTMSWPVPGTLMIEPTESESKAELDRFCDALIGIRDEIRAIEEGRADARDNLLKNAPHTAAAVSSDTWEHPYPRQQAAYPAPWLKQYKFWPAVGRIDNPYGDRNLMCTCPPVGSY